MRTKISTESGQLHSQARRGDRWICRLNWLWVMLMIATAASFFGSRELSVRPFTATALIAGVAYVKCRLVLFSFMEVSEAPTGWRLFFEIWLIGVAAEILLLF